MSVRNLENGFQSVCQVCDSGKIDLILDLGFQSPCDSLLTLDRLNYSETTYPLRLVRCSRCQLVQIDYVVDPQELFFPEYPYVSGITQSLVERLHATSKSFHSKFSFPTASLIVDIGSNDGTLLQGFKNLGYKTVGVEASNVADIANKNGITTVKGFFNPKIASEIRASYGGAKLITATNVFAHVSKLNDFMNGVETLLDEDGIFITESHYLGDIYETLQFDSIYHEHLKFYSLASIQVLLKKYNFNVIDVEKISNYGGSIRVFASKDPNHLISERVTKLMDEENKKRVNDLETALLFSSRVQSQKGEIRNLVVELIKEEMVVYGIGCPGRASTLVNFCGLDVSLLPLILEQSDSLKLGMYLPGTHTPVVKESQYLEEQPDYLFLLSWHYSKEIIENLRKAGFKCKIIVPLPKLEIVG